MFRLYDGLRHQWCCVGGCFAPSDVYSKSEAKEKLGAEPQRLIIDVYDYACNGHGYDMICRVPVWAVGKKAVLANDILPEERILLCRGQIVNKTKSRYALRVYSPLQKLLSVYAKDWEKQLKEAFGDETWTAEIRAEDGLPVAYVKGSRCVIAPNF